MIKGKTIVLGVTGSIAAYKAVDLASQLTQQGAKVDVILSQSATEFITPLTFRSLTNRPVITTMWDTNPEFHIGHVDLARAADIVVIAPATADIIAKIAAGIADDMITCTVLATKAPVIISPAMNVNMYENPVTQENIAKLKARGFTFVGPAKGRLATGIFGLGRFVDIQEIIKAIDTTLGKKKDLLNKKIVVTAGGTQEPIDPVRCITNYSSGKMGYAIARAASERGADVTLITTPTSLDKPVCSCIVDVKTAEDMFRAVKDAVAKADVLIMAAAVADYRPVNRSAEKIKRRNLNNLKIELEHTPDILAQTKGNFLRVGFAAESQDLIANAREKLEHKQLDIIVANDITIEDSTFGSDNNQVVIIDRKGNVEELPLAAKTEVAHKILDKVITLLGKK
jgi:phosphopantothenoylcysteine decarboxylase/phosphopantothenate--cysteine ligase